MQTEAVQRNSRIFGDGEVWDTNREQWVRWDGVTWTIDTRPAAGWTAYHRFPKNDSFTPERAADLPDSAPELRTYLDNTVSGSNSHDEAIFVAITDWVRSNLLPPKTLAAALEVLADVNGVETKDVTVLGRDAVEVSFDRFWLDLVATESMVIDRATARTISEHDSDPGGTYDIDTTLVEVVEEIPVHVRKAFDEHANGDRVYVDGHTPTAEDVALIGRSGSGATPNRGGRTHFVVRTACGKFGRRAAHDDQSECALAIERVDGLFAIDHVLEVAHVLP